MSDIIETVRIVAAVTNGNPHGYSVINACDMTDDHVIWDKNGVQDAPKPADALVELMALDEAVIDETCSPEPGTKKPGRPRKG